MNKKRSLCLIAICVLSISSNIYSWRTKQAYSVRYSSVYLDKPGLCISVSRSIARYAAIIPGIMTFFLVRKFKLGVLANLGAGIGVSCGLYYYFYSFTPQGKFSEAERTLSNLSKNQFAANYFESEQEFFNKIDKSRIKDLKSLQKDLIYFINEGRKAIKLLRDAKCLSTDENDVQLDPELKKKCRLLKAHLYPLLNNLTDSVTYIRTRISQDLKGKNE